LPAVAWLPANLNFGAGRKAGSSNPSRGVHPSLWMALVAIIVAMPFAANEISPRGTDSLPLGIAMSPAEDRHDAADALSVERQVIDTVAASEAAKAWADNETALADKQHATANGDDQALLRNAIAGYRRALSFYDSKGDAANAGIVSANLLAAFLELKGQDAANLSGDEVHSLARAALAATDRQANPLVWSRLQIEIGTFLLATGARRGYTATVENAVTAFRSGLENAQHDGRSPREWAEAENLLANALEFLGQSQNSQPQMRAALQALNNAWVLYQYAGLDQYRFFFEARIATLQQQLEQTAGVPQTAAVSPQNINTQ
jgi:hypothetical protein